MAKSLNTFEVASVTAWTSLGVCCLAHTIFDQLLNYESSAYADFSFRVEEALVAVG